MHPQIQLYDAPGDETPSPKSGRPPGFLIDGTILRQLRKTRGLAPEAAHELALPDTVIQDESRGKAWRRWESTGRIGDCATAERVAAALGTTVIVLQGGPAPDRVQEIAQQLRRQADAGNARAQELLSIPADPNDARLDVAESLATRGDLGFRANRSGYGCVVTLGQRANLCWKLATASLRQCLAGAWAILAAVMSRAGETGLRASLGMTSGTLINEG